MTSKPDPAAVEAASLENFVQVADEFVKRLPNFDGTHTTSEVLSIYELLLDACRIAQDIGQRSGTFWHDRYFDLAKDVMALAGLPTDFEHHGLNEAMTKIAAIIDSTTHVGELREALQKLKSYNEDIRDGKINYRPQDHIDVAESVLARLGKEGQ